MQFADMPFMFLPRNISIIQYAHAREVEQKEKKRKKDRAEPKVPEIR